MATLTLSHHANADHTVDDLTVGQRVKAHPRYGHVHAWGCARDYWIITSGPKRLVLIKMDRSGRRIRFAARNLLHADE